MRLAFVVILLLCSFLVNVEWIQTNELEGGYTGTDIFAATYNSSIWYSADDGRNYFHITSK